MRFQVPQFIEVEDKIFGPLTFKQFVYVTGGVGLAVILFLFLPRFPTPDPRLSTPDFRLSIPDLRFSIPVVS